MEVEVEVEVEVVFRYRYRYSTRCVSTSDFKKILFVLRKKKE
jgi:hypothetical protein